MEENKEGSVATSIQSELARAKKYLRDSGLAFTPDHLKEHLMLSQSAATLGRKLRQASEDNNNPELLRSYYVNSKGRRIVEFKANPDYNTLGGIAI